MRYDNPEEWMVRGDRSIRPTIGFELEVDSNFAREDADDIAHALERDNAFDNFYATKSEGSVSGFEIVSHPFTYPWYKSNQKMFIGLLEFLKSKGVRSDSGAYNCGMHVHVSNPPSSDHRVRLRKMVFGKTKSSSLNKFSHLISGRPTEKIQQWASLDPRSGCGLRDNEGTQELRIFSGTLDPMKFFANIEHAYGLYEYTQSFKSIRLSSYVQWVHRNRSELRHLSSYLNALGYQGEQTESTTASS